MDSKQVKREMMSNPDVAREYAALEREQQLERATIARLRNLFRRGERARIISRVLKNSIVDVLWLAPDPILILS